MFATLLIFLALLMAMPALAAPQSPVSTYSDVTERSYRARERFEAEPKNAEAAYNFAVYQTLVGDRQYAQQVFTKAVQLKPDDFLSHLGLGQMIANDPACGAKIALVELARAEALASSPKTAFSVTTRSGQLDMLGKTYLAIECPAKALVLYQKAYALPLLGNQRQILQMLVRAALADKNIKEAAGHMAALTAGSVNERQLLLLLAANCSAISAQAAATSKSKIAKLDQFIFDQAIANFGNDAEVFYTLGRNFEAAKCSSMASRCYSKAVALAPDDGQYALAHCARLVLEGKRQAAQDELRVMASKSLGQEPSPRRSAFAGAIAAGLKILNGRAGNSGKSQPYRTSLMEFSRMSCSCKMTAFNYLLRRLPGVVYARIAQVKGPRNLVIYDPLVASPEKIWAKLGRDVTYKIVPGLSRSIVDFPTLAQTALDNYEMPLDPERKFYEFEPLPLLP